MSTEKLIAASILIGDRSYRVRVEAHEEEHLRKTVKVINEKIIEFKTTLAGKDMQDYVAMVMLWYATQANSEVKRHMDEEIVQENLNKISKLLDAHVPQIVP